MNNTFDFTHAQSAFSTQANDIAKLFTTHATKIAAAQQTWLQGQADAIKAQFEAAASNKDLAASAQSFQNNLQPAAQGLIKHAQDLFELTLAAQKDLTAKAQDSYLTAATQANASIEAGIKQLPNQGEPFVSAAKNASQAVTGAFEQITAQVKTAQAAYEAQIAKLFDSALAAVVPAAAVVAKAKK